MIRTTSAAKRPAETKGRVTSWHRNATGLWAEGPIRALPQLSQGSEPSAPTLCCTNFLYPLRSVDTKGTCVSVCGPGTRHGGGAWELVQKAESGSAPDKTQGGRTAQRETTQRTPHSVYTALPCSPQESFVKPHLPGWSSLRLPRFNSNLPSLPITSEKGLAA